MSICLRIFFFFTVALMHRAPFCPTIPHHHPRPFPFPGPLLLFLGKGANQGRGDPDKASSPSLNSLSSKPPLSLGLLQLLHGWSYQASLAQALKHSQGQPLSLHTRPVLFPRLGENFNLFICVFVIRVLLDPKEPLALLVKRANEALEGNLAVLDPSVPLEKE